ncbi:CvpA family protein [Cesiribacter sp. SM1]|uniref:CvpA family protein n=1 Tax=Cesiribacter sp. SM1 TaxID=2861196 RepID=UPI001CD4FD06|nr:CvpA family protein [Cesiribacter sp. SM1]
MNALDVVILLLLIWGTFSGFRKGLLLEIIGIVAFVIGIVVGLKMLQWSIDWLSGYVDINESLLPYIAFFVLFVLVVVGINLIGNIASKALHLTFLGVVDSLLGAVAGLLKWALGISVLFWVASTMELNRPGGLLTQSWFYDLLAPLAPAFFDLIGQALPAARRFFNPS